MGRTVPLKWAEQSRIEKWAETSGPRSPGPKWFWAEESRNHYTHPIVLDRNGPKKIVKIHGYDTNSQYFLKMVDEATKRSLAQIPLLKTKAGPRDGEQWVNRLKEEYQSLINVQF